MHGQRSGIMTFQQTKQREQGLIDTDLQLFDISCSSPETGRQRGFSLLIMQADRR
jgi:6-phosphogluconate dehydrogenase (decarboxylating)